jgi:uncharacterized protein (DUF433 family)
MKSLQIIRDPEIMHGEPIISGTRITVALILDHLADGYLPEEIIAEYPQLTKSDIKGAAMYASKALTQMTKL